MSDNIPFYNSQIIDHNSVTVTVNLPSNKLNGEIFDHCSNWVDSLNTGFGKNVFTLMEWSSGGYNISQCTILHKLN